MSKLPEWQHDLLDEIIDSGMDSGDGCTDWELEKTPRNLKFVETAERWEAKQDGFDDYTKPHCYRKKIITNGITIREYLRHKLRSKK